MRCPAAAGSIPGQGNEMMMAEVSLDELGPVDCGVVELPAGATSSTIPEAEDETVLAARIAAHGGHALLLGAYLAISGLIRLS